MSKKKIIFITIIAIAVIVALALVFSGGSKVEYTTAPVERGEVAQTVDVTGSVSSAEDIELNFRATGRLGNVNINPGDKVKAGQMLATLDAGALQSRIIDAESALLEAQANLDKTMAGATAEDIRLSEISLDSAKNDLESLKHKRDIELKNYKNSAVVKVNNEITVASAALETINNTLHSTDAEGTLGVLSSGSVDNAELSQSVAKNSVVIAKSSTILINENSDDSAVMAANSQVKKALNDVRVCLTDVFTVLENTIISEKLTQTELDALVAGIQAEHVSISTSKTNLQTAEANWTNSEAYYRDLVTKAEDAVKTAAANLIKKKAGPESYEIAAAKAAVTKAEANLSYARANYSDAVIKAPVAGVITEVNQKPGEQTSLGAPVIKMIGTSNLEIEVDIPESDIAKVKIGQTAAITLDSFGDDTAFSGTVTFINPAETIISDVVYYEVKVQFNELAADIKPGMTANVTLKTSVKSAALRLPLRAVKQKNGNKIVEILVNNQPTEKIVEVGLKGDDYYELISGLAAGEEVITFVKNGS